MLVKDVSWPRSLTFSNDSRVRPVQKTAMWPSCAASVSYTSSCCRQCKPVRADSTSRFLRYMGKARLHKLVSDDSGVRSSSGASRISRKSSSVRLEQMDTRLRSNCESDQTVKLSNAGL